MNRLARMVTLAATLSLGLLLSDCSSFDPTDIMDNMFASQKKPLPGERKPLFPTGTPGVSQGLPPELVKGYQPPPQTDATQGQQAGADAAERPKPKPKPKPKVANTPPPPSQPSAPTAAMAPAGRPAPSQSSPWPDPPPSRQSAAPSNGGTIWPDPPAAGTVTR